MLSYDDMTTWTLMDAILAGADEERYETTSTEEPV